MRGDHLPFRKKALEDTLQPMDAPAAPLPVWACPQEARGRWARLVLGQALKAAVVCWCQEVLAKTTH